MKVGILGGGQLGRMLALAGYPLGLSFRVLDPAPDACVGQVVADHVVAGFDDEATLLRFADGLDVVTYEWENVPVEAVRYLSRFVQVEPSLDALETAQDRLLEKALFRRLGIETAPFAAVDSRDDLDNAVRVVGLPAILKTRRLGYDGKGQHKIDTQAGVEPAWIALGGQPLVLEGFVPFERELSIIAIREPFLRDPRAVTQRWTRPAASLSDLESIERSLQRSQSWMPPEMAKLRREAMEAMRKRSQGPGVAVADMAFYPLTENVHRDGILRLSRAPAPGLTPELQAHAEELARLVMDATAYCGVLAIELFQHQGRLLANEMAPRVHNSAHWTIEGAETSQFENHLRAICVLPLGSTAPRGHSAMLNLVGRLPEREAILGVPGAHMHIYGKEPRPGRKVGHITLRADDAAGLATSLEMLLPRIQNEG